MSDNSTARASGDGHAAGSAIAAGSPSAARDAAVVFGDAWRYAPAPEGRDHVKIAPRYDLFIGGAWRAPESGRYFETVSPSTEEKLSEVAEAGAKDVDAAVQAARAAYDKHWSRLRPIERGKYVYRLARAIQEKARELAVVE